MRKKIGKNEKVIWILRFSDGYTRSFYGFLEDAHKLAEKRKQETGFDYIIA